MKKLKVLAIMLATVLCCCVAAFVVACKDKNTDPKPTPSGTAEVPVTEGKVTFYLTLGEGSAEIPEYGAIFYAGGLTGWAEAAAPAFTKLDDTDVYYVQLEVDTTLTQYDEYKVTLGYNAASGLPADKLGVQWSLISDECPDGLDNLKFTMAEGATKVDLGTHTFSTALSAPETVDKVTLKVTFDQALGATDEVYIMGGFNGWDSTAAKATANADRTIYSLELKDILCTDYEYKIVILATGDNVVIEDEDGNDLGVWGYYFADPTAAGYDDVDGKVYARTEVSAGGANLPLSIIKRDNNSYVDIAGTVSVAVPEDDIKVKGLDLSKADLTEGETKDEEGNTVGNGEYTNILSVAGTKTLTVEFTEALDEDVIVFALGDFNGWPGTGVGAQMIISGDRKSATLDLALLPGDYGFKLCFFHKDVFDGNVWSGDRAEYSDVVNADGSYGNATVSVKGYDNGEVALFDAAIVAPSVTHAN